MKKVFRYEIYDINTDSMKPSKSYATKEYIEKIEGSSIIQESAADVEEIYIDGDGKVKAEHMKDLTANGI